jgi:SAM-dependent methyltransferase
MTVPGQDERCRISEAAERNKGPILGELKRVLPREGLVLEIASGTGQHVAHFAAALPALTWQPSDADAPSRASVMAWTEQLPNVCAPIELDVRAFPWPVTAAATIVCTNMIHIAPWAATEGLLRGAGEVIKPAGVLFLYGPFRRFGAHTAPSNAAFDAQLRARDPAWGVRDLEAVVDLASAAGFLLREVIDMPANNVAIVFRRRSDEAQSKRNGPARADGAVSPTEQPSPDTASRRS